MSRSRLLVLPLVFALASLAGCGRRGPLEAPPGATPPTPAAARTGVVDAVPGPDDSRSSLARRTTGDDSLNREQVLAPTTAVTVPKTPFILDPLL